MSDSKFLPFQDLDGDGLNDVCKEEFVVSEEKVCPKCTPNPYAPVPNWRVRKNFAPFLNEKVCKYQITFTTPLSTTGYIAGMSEEEAKDALEEIFNEYETPAIEILLQIYSKDSSEGSIELIRDVIEHVDYDLEARPGSRLKLLYSVPFENLDALPPASPDEDEASDIEVTYAADEIGPMLMRVRKGLNLFNRYLKVYRKIENGNLYFEGRRVFNLDLYGDFGFGLGEDSLMKQVGDQLDDFMRANGYNIRGLGSIGSDVFPSFDRYGGKDVITEITFGFTAGYRIQKIIFYTEGCGGKPIVFSNKCSELREKPAWKDRTAVGYFAQLMEMDNDLRAREPKPWLDFLIEYTYPTIYSETALTYQEDGYGGSCVSQALAEEGKQLADDIFDEIFSLGDAIAYKFHETLCKASYLEASDEKKRLGLEAIVQNTGLTEEQVLEVYTDEQLTALGTLETTKINRFGVKETFFGNISDQTISELVASEDPIVTASEAKGNAYGMALEQAYATLKAEQTPFADLCVALLTSVTGTGDDDSRLSQLSSCIGSGGGKPNTPTWDQIDKFWKGGFDIILKCGLFDLTTEVINCLFSGLTLEEALAQMVEAALNAMSIDNFGDLFVGLPAETQQELDALVKQKLAEGEVLPPSDDEDPEYTDETFGNTRIWEDENLSFTEKTKAYLNIQPYEENPTSTYQSDTRTLVQQYDNAGSEFDSTIVMQAYFKALIELYSNDLLSLVDELGKFPGAPIVAQVITLLDCPRPPIFTPSIAEFIKDIDLPFCRDVDPLVWPKFNNPFGWLASIKGDILRLLFEAIKCQLQLTLIKIIIKLVVKICQLIGNAICNTLGIGGDILTSLPDIVTGRENLKGVIRESICGEDASEEQVEETIAQMVAELGVGGAALADQQTAISFMEDLSGALTYEELTQMLSGEPSDSALSIVDSIIEYEYPQYRDALPNSTAAGAMFKNMGNLMPASFRKTMRDSLNQIPLDNPANPSICLDPDRLSAFNDLRATLLEGRVSPEQSKEMFCSMRDQMTEDLGDLAPLTDVDNLPDYLAAQMPPMVSEPGCENGLIPYEPQTTADAITGGLTSDLEKLKVDYADDMLGSGPGEKNWGMMNMILSDTMGTPLTTHYRKAANQERYVDYYAKQDISEVLETLITSTNPFAAFSLIAGTINNQRGAFPTKVGAYLQQDMDSSAETIVVSISNVAIDDVSTTIDLLDVDKSGGRDRRTIFDYSFDGTKTFSIDILELPDMGYNVQIDTNTNEDGYIESVTFTELARKENPDITMSFYDNAKGLKSLGQSDYAYGFDIYAYLSDFYKNDDGDIVNMMTDNMRIKIDERNNIFAATNSALQSLAGIYDVVVDGTNVEEGETKGWYRGSGIITDTAFEFLAVDDTLASFTTEDQTIEEYFNDYPRFLESFNSTNLNFIPQTYLFNEIITKNNTFADVSNNQLQDFQNKTIQAFLSKTMKTVADIDASLEESSWSFGAQYDSLSIEDLEYGINNGGTWVPYFETEYTNKDMILGISYDQFKNELAGTPENTRVFYLNPGSFGGNYRKPPFYIKPQTNKGWLGMVDVLFPEISACTPRTNDLVDFDEIQDFVDEIYSSIPEDPRLQFEEECVVEVPYNRVLDRGARAGIIGLIKASIRIYATSHFIKALPTFTKFKPDFPQVFSTAYASYIVEDMQRAFLDAQPDAGEFFNTFKDTEFWYGFLEQAVQSYSYLVDAGKIDPPASVVKALIRLNDLQENYEYPSMEDFEAAEANGETERALFDSLGLRRYRQEKNLEAVKASEEDAKIVMKEFVIQELNYMGDKFIKNLARLNIRPEVKDVSYYVLEEFTQGSDLSLNSSLNPNGTFKAVYGDLPRLPWEENDEAGDDYYYTNGGELVVDEDRDFSGYVEGQEYVGYYHVHIDDETGDVLYMAGEVHTEEAHDLLKPLSNVITLEIGDIPSLNNVSYDDVENKPFVVEKYMRIGNDIYAPDDAMSIIGSYSDQTKLVSDVYPGNMKLVLNEGVPVGIEGELGLRYGLLFSVVIGGIKYELTRTEIDALDLSLENVPNLEANSKLLLCLINHLVQDDSFRMITRYIIPMPKLLSLTAIYNDMGMLPSIGEITVDKGETYSLTGVGFNAAGKPGVQVIPEIKTVTNADGTEVDIVVNAEVDRISELDTLNGSVTYPSEDELAPDGAWAHVDDRNRFTPFFLEWDDWDQIVLRNSTGRVKKLFKNYYNSRDFGDDGGSLFDFLRNLKLLPGALALRRLKMALMPASISRLVPWWMKRRLRTNPFNANDELCKKDD